MPDGKVNYYLTRKKFSSKRWPKPCLQHNELFQTSRGTVQGAELYDEQLLVGAEGKRKKNGLDFMGKVVPKMEGGKRFRDLETFNLALLAS